MISGAKDINTYNEVDDEDYSYSPFGGRSNTSFDNVIESLRERKRNLENGGINCIPSPFVRFRSEYPGIEQGRYAVVTANQKVGKCFGKGTRVRMADNTIKNIEDIQIGDWVMSPNKEKPKQVLSLGHGKETMYRIHSEMHDDLIVNESHVMYLHKCKGPRRKERFFTMTVKELLSLQKSVKNFDRYYRMVASDECEFGIDVNLPIEPYFYGLWLGDGTKMDQSITTPDKEIVDYLEDYANRLGCKLSKHCCKDTAPRYIIARVSHKDKGFKPILDAVTGNQKEHINRDYLNASIEDRYQLLAGIIDTDGYLNPHKTGYRVTMQYLSCIKDIQELARSLGMATTIRTKHNYIYDKDYYELRINGQNCIKIPTRVKKCIPTLKNPRYFSFTIEEIGEGEYFGLTLGGNHLFLLEDYTIVHNTKIASFIYLYNVLDYCFDNSKKCSVHILYFALEESPQLIREKYISYLLFKLDKIRISPEDLRSTSEDYPVPDEILDLLDTRRYKERLEFFDSHVEFKIDETSPTQIFSVCEAYAKNVGTIKTDSNGEFESYVPDDPNHYKMMIVDHISLIDTERGMTVKQAIDKLSSEYCVKYLRNRYGYTCVIVQQQATEAESLEAVKSKKMMPTSRTLADSKYTARDADIVIGLFNPNKFGMSNFHGYDITRLGSNARFLQIIENRHGNSGGICPLLFDGVTGYFEELPRVDDDKNIEKSYTRVEDMRKRKISLPKTIKRIMFLMFNKNID